MIGQALLLKYKPVNLDVLPLYIALVIAAPAVLWGLLRRPNWTLLVSALLYFAARHFDWNLPSFPGGKWYFNPFAWQFLFVFGVWCGFGGGSTIRPAALSRPVTIIAAAWLVFAFLDRHDMACADLGAVCAASAHSRDLPSTKPISIPCGLRISSH